MRSLPLLLHSGHPAARLLAGCALLIVALTSTSAWVEVGLIVLALLLIRAVEADWRNIRRLFSLLRWFVIPIFLLHALFSPGQLMLPGTALPFTWEGASEGLWLSLRFVAIFVAAMLLFRLLHRAEWLRGLLYIPLIGQNAIAYLLMLTAMRRSIGDQLGQMRQLWRMRPDWRRAALFLLAVFRGALATGRQQAWALWLRWPEEQRVIQAATIAGSAGVARSLPLSIAWLLFGLVLLILARP